jgi:putative tryptophan/tyrosine transport system substrate-binding protein
MLKRRVFITGLGATVALPALASAQPASAVRRIGVLMAYAENDTEPQSRIAAFRNELAKLGWDERQNLVLDIRWSTADVEKIRRDAQALITSKPDLILSSNSPTTAALLQQTRKIAIIFATVADPVESGFVASIARPGGNVTGFTNLEGSIAGKWLELVKQIAPAIDRVAFLYNPATAPFSEIYLKPFEAAAMPLKLRAIAAPVNEPGEIEATMVANAPGGLIVMPGPFFANQSEQVIALAARHRMPAIYPFRYYAKQGGLMTYGNDQADNYRHAAAYADRILKGASPAELPVVQPTKFELVVNLQTAKRLGLDPPPTMLAEADEVIE